MALQLTGRTRLRVLLIVALVIAGLAVLFWVQGRRADVETVNLNRAEQLPGSASESPPPALTSPTLPLLTATPFPIQTPGTPSPEGSQTSNDLTPPAGFVGTLKLIIPVAGVRPDQLLDTFTDARSEGRAHDAIDIHAPAGTAVVAAADGELIKLFQSERGGTTIYQLSIDKKLLFYYAHLQRYAEGLVVGRFAKQGEVIGYVGDTGNAGAGNFHLHFSISIVADPKRYWEGANINPYPLLHR